MGKPHVRICEGLRLRGLSLLDFETEKSEVGGIDFYDYQICRREKFYRIATVL